MIGYYQYILPPLTGAFIGWLTNYIAIKLLFRPLEPIRIFGYNLQGLIPKRRKEIAKSIAHTIENELMSSKDLASTLNSVDLSGEVEKAVEEVIEHRFSTLKVAKIPIIGLLSENLIYHVKYIITKEILKQVESKKDAVVKRFTDSVDVKGMLTDKIDGLDLVRFEGLLTEFIARELRHIEWLGGVMGFLIGIAQALIFYFFR